MSGVRSLTGLALVCFALGGESSPGWGQTSPAPAAEKPSGPVMDLPPPSDAPASAGPAQGPGPAAPPGAYTGAPANAAGQSHAAVTLEWQGPTQAQAGRPAAYTLCVRNASVQPVQQVLVRVQTAPGIRATETQPAANAEGDVLWWDLGTLAPRQQKDLQIHVVPDAKGDMTCHAWVTFTGAAALRLKVSEPRVALKITPPEKAAVGETVTFQFVVSNPGDAPAEQVRLHADLSEGLEHPAGKHIDFDVGNLPPREARAVRLVCAAKAGGEQKCEATVEGKGDLRAHDRAGVAVATPRLDLEVSGPKLRYLDRKAVYAFKVSNPGDGAASGVTLTEIIPAGFKFHSASDGGCPDPATGTVCWALGEVPAGQSKEVRLEVVAVEPGEYQHQVTAHAARGLRASNGILTRVEGVSTLVLEVKESDNPVEVGAETTFEVRITNNGSKTENDIKLVAVVPDQMQFKSATGPTRFQQQGKEIVFEPLPRLEAKGDSVFRVTATATSPGDARFKAQLTSASVSEPVVEMQSIRVYQD
jgi:uncharacterized repeat protein (TIGR01451 family)